MMSNLWLYITALIFFSIFILAKSPKFLGWVGEKSVSRRLSKLNPAEYKIINDIVLPTGNNGTTQIDHIIVSIYGVFVIETKNYKGWIFGSENSNTWTQVIYKRKEKLRNPIHQNYGHIKCIEQMIDERFPIIGIVCFSGRTTLKVDVTKSHVIYTQHLIETIRAYKTPRLYESDINRIYNTIISKQISGKQVNKAHVKNVKAKIVDREIQVANKICPRCGGTLIERNGKNGRFIGCKSYPKCRFTYG